MAKILVVDDESDLELLIKQKFRKKIREGKYQFVFAQSGQQALDMLKEDTSIDIVLSDINMPGMDGLTLLTKLPETNPMIKAVMVSAYGDMDNIRSAMNRGAFDFVCKPVNFDDLDLTIVKTLEHVEQIKQTLKAIKENDILKMYVDENVLHFMTRKEFEASLMLNENIEATVLFIDICGFTSITEHIEPDRVVQLINTFFDIMVKEIIHQKGRVDKFMGDAVMAVFKGDYHLDRAIDAALAAKDKIAECPAIESADKLFQPQVSIGINSGEMISGNIGSASLRRLDYTVIGDVVNVAQRLQSIAKPGQVILPEPLFHKAKEYFQMKRVGEVSLKNKLQQVTIYEVVS